MWTLIFTFVLYWAVAFAGCLTVAEIAQDALYDEVTPRSGLKSALAALILGSMMTYLHPSFDTMFTANFGMTVLQGIVWFAVFMFVLQFHPWHALGIGVLMMCLLAPLATMGVDSMFAADVQTRRIRSGTTVRSEPVRGSLSSGAAPAPNSGATPTPTPVPAPAAKAR